MNEYYLFCFYAIYFSGMKKISPLLRKSYPSNIPYGCIYKLWFRFHVPVPLSMLYNLVVILLMLLPNLIFIAVIAERTFTFPGIQIIFLELRSHEQVILTHCIQNHFGHFFTNTASIQTFRSPE